MPTPLARLTIPQMPSAPIPTLVPWEAHHARIDPVRRTPPLSAAAALTGQPQPKLSDKWHRGFTGDAAVSRSAKCRQQASEAGRAESLVEDAAQFTQLPEGELIKEKLEVALSGLNRGIFGMKKAQKDDILDLIAALESLNPVPSPTTTPHLLGGSWRLLFSTIAIRGSKRTKLGLRQFVSLGEFTQIIDVEDQRAVNEVQFSVAGMDVFMGALTIEATYAPVSPQRVQIDYQRSSLVPQQLEDLFRKNSNLLLSIFNPEGWLDTTYVDAYHRIGRDDKGNVFYLERQASTDNCNSGPTL